jgi:protein SCO1/2
MTSERIGTPRRRLAYVVLVGALGLALGVWLASRLQPGYVPQPSTDLAATVLPEPKPLTEFRAQDQNQAPFTLARLKGHWSFLFFGYTHCPDVCPTTLAALAQVHDRLAQSPGALDATQFVFVSVDPERDSPEQLGRYVRYFHPGFLGVTAPEADLDKLARQLGVLHVRAQGATAADYAMDHSASIFLVDAEARLVAVFSPPPQAEGVANAFMRIRKMGG